jgi:sugar phosphate isomerase/epimerase
MSALSPARTVGVQSWTFREFRELDGLCAKLKEVDVTSTELSGRHAKFDDLAQHDAPIAKLKQAGVNIVSMGVQTFTGNPAVERNWFEFAKKAGAKYMSAAFKIDTYRDAIKVACGLSEVYGIKLAIHCHGGYSFGGSFDVIDHMISLGKPYIGVNIDTAWCMQATGKPVAPVEWVRKWGSSVYGVHYKDFVFDRSGKWSETVVGEGNLPLKDMVTALEETGFSGFAVIEYEADPQDPAPAVKRCLEKIRSV